MLKKIVNVAMVLSVCLSIGYAKPLKECKSERDRLNGCVEQRYYDDDRRKLQVETPYKNGKINGVKKVYYESGQLSRETLFENGKTNGVVKSYYKSGQLEEEVTYENDKVNGVRKEYYESGKLKKEILYEYDRTITRKEYDESGKLIKSQQNK